MSAIFQQIFISHHIITLQKLWKMFLFHLKTFFQSQYIQIVVFPSSACFLSPSHRFRGCSKISFKVYDAINCLNKNFITHFVWYYEKEEKYDIKILTTGRVLNKDHFYQKIMQKCARKASCRSPFNFVEWPKMTIACKKFF